MPVVRTLPASLRLSRLTMYGLASTAMAVSVVFTAFRERSNFYAAAVYLSKSSAFMLIMMNFCIFLTLLFGMALQRLFFGQLRPIEVEHLYERAWYAVTESLLAMTIFRRDFDTSFVVRFITLLFMKVFHWLGGDRVEFMEQTPNVTTMFHVRMVALLATLWVVDCFMVAFAVEVVWVAREKAGIMIMFASEFMILYATIVQIALKYSINAYDRRLDVEWEQKSMWIFYVDLFTDFLKLTTYLIFFGVILAFYGLPLNVIRDVYITGRSFIGRVRDLLRYRAATRNMDERYPDASREELEAMSDQTCIICREEMEHRTSRAEREARERAEGGRRGEQQDDGSGGTGGPRQGPNDTPKKLPCGHVFHFHCLRSWLERQQSCPTCRRPVLENPPPENPPRGTAPAPRQPGQAPRGGVAPAATPTPTATSTAGPTGAGTGAGTSRPENVHAIYQRYLRGEENRAQDSFQRFMQQMRDERARGERSARMAASNATAQSSGATDPSISAPSPGPSAHGPTSPASQPRAPFVFDGAQARPPPLPPSLFGPWAQGQPGAVGTMGHLGFGGPGAPTPPPWAMPVPPQFRNGGPDAFMPTPTATVTAAPAAGPSNGVDGHAGAAATSSGNRPPSSSSLSNGSIPVTAPSPVASASTSTADGAGPPSLRSVDLSGSAAQAEEKKEKGKEKEKEKETEDASSLDPPDPRKAAAAAALKRFQGPPRPPQPAQPAQLAQSPSAPTPSHFRVSDSQLTTLSRATREGLEERLRVLESVQNATYTMIEELSKVLSVLPADEAIIRRSAESASGEETKEAAAGGTTKEGATETLDG